MDEKNYPASSFSSEARISEAQHEIPLAHGSILVLELRAWSSRKFSLEAVKWNLSVLFHYVLNAYFVYENAAPYLNAIDCLCNRF